MLGTNTSMIPSLHSLRMNNERQRRRWVLNRKRAESRDLTKLHSIRQVGGITNSVQSCLVAPGFSSLFWIGFGVGNVKEAFLPRRVALGTFVWVFRFRNWRKIMNIEGKTEKCANPQCKCTDQSMGGCCSDSCKNAVEIAEPECHCGHPDCI